VTAPVITVKDGVTLNPTAPAGFVIQAALVMASQATGLALRVTCGSEGHPVDDPHTRGDARDIGVVEFRPEQILAIKAALEVSLHTLAPMAKWTVLYETPSEPSDARLAQIAYINSGATAPHFHIQPVKGSTYPPTTGVPA